MITRLILLAGADRTVLPLLLGRAIRTFADGYMAVLLSAYLLLGFKPASSAPLRGSLATPLVVCGALKITYDLALLFAFRHHEDRE